MKRRTVREIAAEIMLELDGEALRRRVAGDPLLDGLGAKAFAAIGDIVLGVLARHDGSVVVNDKDLPAAPLPERRPHRA